MSTQLADLLVGAGTALVFIVAAITVGILMFEEFLLDARKYPKAKGYVRSAKMSTQLVAGGIVFGICLITGFVIKLGSDPSTDPVTEKISPPAMPAYEPSFLIGLGLFFLLAFVSFMLVVPVVARTYIVMRREDEKGDKVVQEAEALLRRKPVGQ